MVLLSAYFFSKSVYFGVVVFSIFFFLVISVECQACWVQIMPIGLNCFQRLSAGDTSK